MACRSRKCGTIQHEFHSRGSAEGRCRTNKKQTDTALILLEKLCTEKEKRRHRSLAKNQVGTCGISERRFIQGDRPEAGRELAMTDRELAHLFLRVALDQRRRATIDQMASTSPK